MLTAIVVSAQVLGLLQGICTTGSTRNCKLTGCASADQVCLADRTWGACSCNCSDQNACTADSWSGIQCVHTDIPVQDDQNPCTADSCDPTLGMRHTPVAAGTSCQDADVCNGAEACNGSGACVAGTPVVIDDGNACTADSCDSATGAVGHVPTAVGSSCSDGNYCDGFETCDGLGSCLASFPPSADDGNACTSDSCDPVTGVWNTPVPAGTSCADATVCNGAEACSASGTCVSGVAPAVDDRDPCTADACDPVIGVSHTWVAGCIYTPPDPATQATQLSRTAVTSFADSISFLYSGSTPIQLGADPGVFDPTRVAVVRGLVSEDDATPVPGARVSILGHPEYGRTYTRVDGRFDLAVNGGGSLTVEYWREGYLPSQRTVQPVWKEYSSVPDVILLPYDPRSTVIAIGAAGTQVASGSPVTDAAGTRQVTILVPANTQAAMVLPDGTSQPLSSMTIRATEYTAGRLGVKAMPGELPPASGYTYAVELGVDEATSAGATDIQFNQPVPFYVDNFLRFPVGGAVPTGYYDRTKGKWLPSADGRVVKVLAIADGAAQLDVDGTGTPADVVKLAALGITSDELVQLAQLYQAGKELWRARVTHFTPWDCNWPMGCLGACPAPSVPPPPPHDPDRCQSATGGSIIECQGQVLGERIPIVGTPLELHYESDRVPGFTPSIEIPLTGSTVPGATLVGIDVTVRIAGQVIRQPFTPPFVANQRWNFVWDGKDAYGRPLIGRALADIELGYNYQVAIYLAPDGTRSFGAVSTTGVPYTGAQSPGFPITRTQKFTTWLGTWDQRSTGLGGWSLSAHHQYDPTASALYLGTGGRRRAEDLPGSIKTIAGGGSTYEDGRPATEASLQLGAAVTVGPDRSVYLSEFGSSRVRRVAPDGLLWTVAGGDRNCIESGEGILATQACFGYVDDIALGPDEALYFSDYHANRTNYLWVSRILKVGTDGIVHTFAGAGPPGETGDGGPAIQAQIARTSGIAFGPDGSLYLLSSGRLRRVDPSGTITTVAGDGSSWSSGDGGPARQARFYAQGKLAVGPDGSIYLPDTMNRRLRKITPDGIIRTIAGPGAVSASGDGGPAINAGFGYIYGIALGRDGSIFLAEDYSDGSYTHSRIRKIAPNGTISTISGGSPRGYAGDGGSAGKALLHSPRALAARPDGLLYVADYLNNRIRLISTQAPLSLGGSYYIPSEDAEQLHVFDAEGRHLQTIDARTNVPLYSFQYGASGWLSTITDRDGLVTTIERDGSGKPTAIMAPYGQRTTLALDLNGYLASVTNPANEAFGMTYDGLGLLSTFTDPRGDDGLHTFTFTDGRLTQDTNPAGGVKQLARTNGSSGYQVQLTTAFDATRDIVSMFDVQQLGSGERINTDTASDGTQTVTRFGADGTVTTTYADGSTSTSSEQPDPRFGMHAPLFATTDTVPSGLQKGTTQARSVTLAEATNRLSLTRQVDTETANGRARVTTFDAAARTRTIQTAAGRTTVAVLDPQGRVTEVRPPGYSTGAIWPVQLAYDGNGRLYSATQGSRTITVGYDAQGFPAAFTDPLQRTLHAWYDGAGRVVDQELLGGRHVAFGYDRNGNVTSLTPPSRTAHGFDYTSIDLMASYTPPLAAGTGLLATAYGYNLDGSLAQVLLPDSSTVIEGYDAAGRLASVSTARGTTIVGYDAAGRIGALTAPDYGQVSLGYDGFLKTSETWTGVVAGSVAYTYDSDFRVAGVSVNGSLDSFQYDPDGLLAQAGALAIARDAATGWITGTTAGQVTTSQSRNQYSELSSFSASANGSAVYSYTLDRDAAGRIFRKTETIGGTTTTYGYEYDEAGRLWTASRNGTAVSVYTYDANGNRLSGPVSQTGTYDDQDRMLANGAATYTYGPNGDIRTKTDSGQTTAYAYDALGNLVSASLPDGTLVEYLIDGQNRRVGKKLNGQLVEGFLYEGQLRPVAWLNGAGQVYARFVYGTRVNVPEYMVTASGTFRILTDHLGSPRLVVNTSTGAVAQRVDYDEWGNVLADTAPGFQPFGFAGGLWDRDTGFVRFGARDYDPQTGRWTAKDPIGFEGGLNFYEYCGGDPINFVDESGLSWGSALGNFGIGVLEGVAGTVVVAVLIASGPVGIVAAVALVGYGSFAITTNLYTAISGANPYTGQTLDTEQRIDLASRSAGQIAGSCAGGGGLAKGREFEVPWLLGRGPTGKPGRIAPWGNRTGNPVGEFPHYHRAIPDASDPGNSLPGQGMGNHRPWQGGF